MIEIIGRVDTNHGHHVASQALEQQLPLVAFEFPGVSECHPGTINLILEFPLLVLEPDYRTKPIAWISDDPTMTEVFDFVQIELEAPVNTPAIPAWLYIPHNSMHRATLNYHEVIAARLDLASVGS
jgi:hypothetical protein